LARRRRDRERGARHGRQASAVRACSGNRAYAGAMDPERLPLSREDAAILALGTGTIRGHTCKVILLDGRRSAAELREGIAARLSGEYPLRLRLAAGEPPGWEADPAFALERHIGEARAVEEHEVPALVAELFAE